MTERVTRSKTGNTPRKSLPPGFVETPTRSSRRTPRIGADDGADDSLLGSASGSDAEPRSARKANGVAKSSPLANGNGHAGGHSNGHAKGNGDIKEAAQHAVDEEPADEIEFGGTPGVIAIMVGFPLIMYFMWIGATYYDGKVPLPAKDQSVSSFVSHLGHLVYTGAFPNLKAWTIYWTFLGFEVVMYLHMPGFWTKGKPLLHEGGRQLDYYCSGLWSFWATVAVAVALHVAGLFPLYTIIDEFGPLMSVAILSGIGISVAAYVSAFARGKQHRMTGLPIYDFFMGAELNPRSFRYFDWKMFSEVRMPWYILFLITLGASARQYEQHGYLSLELGFVLMAHFIYANACAKGEEFITPSWDMYHEKWGFMLIFWNFAGVPFTYCHCTLYLSNHDPALYSWPKMVTLPLFVAYLFVYWVWDTTNSQKNAFRLQERGQYVDRKSFPYLPWKFVKDPVSIPTKTGASILCDGWYGKARKLHYTCDCFFALSWGAITGFRSPFPWFYPVFFTAMILHRTLRDVQRCRERYGDAWTEYERRVPYLFIPYVI